MKRTTVSLPDELSKLIEDEARRRRTSVSEVIRHSVIESLVGVEARRLPFAGLIDDPDMAPAAEMEAELDRLWSDDLDRRR